MTVEDFGNKIGGAKKDLWGIRGLNLNDLTEMNTLERDKYVIKNNIWKKPNYDELIQNGLSKRIVYFIKNVRDAIPPKPLLDRYTIDIGIDQEKIFKAQEDYTFFVSCIRDDIDDIKTEEDVKSYYKSVFLGKYCEKKNNALYWNAKEECRAGLTNKLFKTIQVNNFIKIDRQIKEKQFGYTDDEKILDQYNYYFYSKDTFDIDTTFQDKKCFVIKRGMSKTYFYPTDEQLLDKSTWINNTYFITSKGNRDVLIRNLLTVEDAYDYARKNVNLKVSDKKDKERKKSFIPVQLKHLEREGIDYRMGRQIEGDDLLNVFSFFGGEFGNYMNEADRLQSLNYSYEAFKDLARALEIDDKDISLNGTLSIAYGARGSGNAMAHYEPLRNVINLTKLRGAGNLAHEWGHALDDYLAKELHRDCLLSSHKIIPELRSLENLLNNMQYKLAPINGQQRKVMTDFYANSIKFDGVMKKSDKRYWQSREEMFARAFSCYINDKIKGKSDYLCGLCNCFNEMMCNSSGEKEMIRAYPIGDERSVINDSFDDFFNEVKQKGLLHARSKNMNLIAHENDFLMDRNRKDSSTEQLSFFDTNEKNELIKEFEIER